jgi:hypothetical protein
MNPMVLALANVQPVPADSTGPNESLINQRQESRGIAGRSSSEDIRKKIESLNRSPSAGIAEIAKMIESGVEVSVIQSYVENSTVPYNPSASDVLYLHEHGVPSPIITAILHRGGQVRVQQAKAYQENQNRISAAGSAGGSLPVIATAQPPVTTQVVYNYPQPYPVYVPYSYPVYSYNYVLPTYSLYYSHGYRPFYHHYPSSYYGACFPRYSYGIGLSYRSCSPRFSVGASFGNFARSPWRVR